MAARNSIIHIDFQANAGKANIALDTLRQEAEKANKQVTKLKNDLANAKAVNLPTAQIQQLETELKKAQKEASQWQNALQNNMKGVRALDEAIKAFNKGKGSVEGMSAALSKAAENAALLQKSRSEKGSKDWQEMNALATALHKNVLSANTALKELVVNIQQGGTVSKATLTQAKTDLQQMMDLTVRGSAEWNRYSKQLKVIDAELLKIAQAEQKVAQANKTAEMTKRMRNLKTESASGLAEIKRYWETMIAGAEKGSAELKKYEKNLERVTKLDRERRAAKASDVLVDMKSYSIDQVRQAVQDMERLRDSVVKGSNDWKHWNKLVNEGNAYLQKFDEEAKIARGDAMSLNDALKLSSTAGGKGFVGTAKQLQQAEAALEKALATAKKGTPEWKKYQEALAKVRVEMQNAGITSERMQAILDKPANAKNLNELQAAVKRAKAELDLMAGTVDKNSKEYATLASKTKEAEIQLKALQAQAKGTASAFDKAWSRLKTYIGLYVGAAVAMQKLTATMGDVMELSDKMGEVRKTTGFTADEVGRLSDNLKKMDTRTPLVNLMEVAAKAGQLGLKTEEDVLGFTEAANKLMVALPEMGAEAATELLKVALATGEIAKIQKQMDEGLIEGTSAVAVAMTKVGSTIDQLRANSAATAPAITDFVKRVGAVGAQSGITIDQVAALGSAVDALGMRVEMSATALSRMIPAIKNNAFDIAKAIGVTPDTLRNLFETGRGMEAILMIFQHIKDAGMDDESIEQMLGMGNMKEIMKELNQQGARAGIVFAGLSQNVDELRRQLGVASQAYEENMAIQREYDKMNETTAAKWEKLKNQLEEMFVGDSAQRYLGSIIDGLRTIVDIIANAYNSWTVYLAVLYAAFKAGIGQAIMVNLPKAFKALTAASGTFFKTALTGLGAMANSMGIVTARTRLARMEWGKLDAAMKQNIWGAIAAAIAYAAFQLMEWRKATIEAMKEEGKFAAELLKSEQAVEKNFKAVDKATVSVGEANKKLKEAKAALDKAKKAMDGSKESADRLTRAEENLKKAEDDVKLANDAHRASIEQINKIYGSYLGFMLSEISSATELANARELVNAKIRETITLKRKEAALGRIEENMGEERDTSYGRLSQSLSGAIRKQVKTGGGKTSWTTDEKASQDLLRQVTKVAQDASLTRQQAAEKIDKILIEAGKSGTTWEQWRANVRNKALDYQKEYRNVEKKVKDVETQFDAQMQIDREESQQRLEKQYKEADKNYADLEKKHANAQGDAKKKAAANLLKQMDSMEEMIGSAKNYYDLTDKTEKASYDQFVKNTKARLAGMKDQREALLKEAGKYYTTRKTVTGGTTTGGGGGGVWGSTPSAGNTDYGTWDVNELVARRNQMDKFKNILKPDTDIRAVLAEDKALMKALDNGLKEDWKSVMDWYNTERKKIQDELKTERFSTNEGHWRDEKEGKGGRKNRFRESDYALAELDRYYSKRKEQLEEARIKENMSEELFNRQAELLEQEHLERRSKLRDTFTTNDKKAIEEFDKWWDVLNKKNELDELDRQTITSEWAKALASDIGRNNLRAQQDLTKMQEITVKHLNAIAKIVAKERPYDGIVDNLRKNLTELDILFADFEEKNITDPSTLVRAEAERMRFLLGEAENAYTLTFGELEKKMREKGLGDWADTLKVDDQKRQSIIEALHKVYDDVQDAIKKESSKIKKNVDIMWQDVLPGQKTSMKDAYELAISALGVEEGRVSRANSLIGAGAASERAADKLAIKQMQLKISMQEHYYNLIEAEGRKRIAFLEREADLEKQKAERLKKEAEAAKSAGRIEEAQLKARLAEESATKSVEASLDAQHLTTSLNISQAKELTEIEKQREEIIARTEESQDRIYTQLKEWGELLASSIQGVFEASAAGNREYYNERAKLDLTGKGGPGAGTYIVINDEGTDDAEAHYEYLDEHRALERQHEIEQQNARADAWKKLADDLNMKMSEQITDWMNAAAIDANTQAVMANTEAIYASMGATGVSDFTDASKMKRDENGMALDDSGSIVYPIQPTEQPEETPAWKPWWQMTDEEKAQGISNMSEMYQAYNEIAIAKETEKAAALAEIPGYTPPLTVPLSDEQTEQIIEKQTELHNAVGDLSDQTADKQVANQTRVQQSEKATETQMVKGSQGAFAKMIAAANLYGAAYQAMSNDNLSTAQKFEMMALQAAGNAAIAALQVDFSEKTTETAMTLPVILAKCLGINPIYGPVLFAVLSALLGGMMGVAASRLSKGKSDIAKVSGASASAGRLSTGMMTYEKGNINEFTDPDTLTPGRSYNVDAADGKTYRAKYTGRNPRTHITNGPEFHLAGEKGREAIIDAHTTQMIRLNEVGIWKDIQTLSQGGGLSTVRRRKGRGVRAFAEGNLDDFEELTDEAGTDSGGGLGSEQVMQLQASLDRNSDVLERAMTEGIKGVFNVYGKGGLVDSYDTGKKTVTSHGERY